MKSEILNKLKNIELKNEKKIKIKVSGHVTSVFFFYSFDQFITVKTEYNNKQYM